MKSEYAIAKIYRYLYMCKYYFIFFQFSQKNIGATDKIELLYVHFEMKVPSLQLGKPR
jgi:hypothetical protein